MKKKSIIASALLSAVVAAGGVLYLTHAHTLGKAAAAPAPPPVQRFKAGERVEHPSFGAGVVIKTTLTRTDEELVVKFDSKGLKILSGTLAPLKKL